VFGEEGEQQMNVDQLRRVLAEIPGDMPIVLEDCQMGWMANAALYVAPAHVDCRISGNFLRAHHQDGADNCHALLISSLGQTDQDVIDLTPRTCLPEVIDVEVDSITSVISSG
jgi:hypothetical protein